MEKYRLVQEHKAPETSEQFQEENVTGDGFPVVRITQQGKPRNYISYAMGLFVSSSVPFSCGSRIDSALIAHDPRVNHLDDFRLLSGRRGQDDCDQSHGPCHQ
jgi:hypothetical protein